MFTIFAIILIEILIELKLYEISHHVQHPFPPNMRDLLYNGLPTNVKTDICSPLQSIDTKEEVCFL